MHVPVNATHWNRLLSYGAVFRLSKLTFSWLQIRGECTNANVYVNAYECFFFSLNQWNWQRWHQRRWILQQYFKIFRNFYCFIKANKIQKRTNISISTVAVKYNFIIRIYSVTLHQVIINSRTIVFAVVVPLFSFIFFSFTHSFLLFLIFLCVLSYLVNHAIVSIQFLINIIVYFIPIHISHSFHEWIPSDNGNV